jgi:hypothetical protein
MALKEATEEAIYLNNMLNYIYNHLKLSFTDTIPIILIDNEGAKKLAENPEFHKRSKHIDIIYHFTRNTIQKNQIKLVPIPSKYNIADIFTKNVIKPIFINHIPNIITNIQS